MHEVEADLPILHLDAYFEHRLDSLLSEGECERFDGNTLVLVEWANHASEWWPKNGVYMVLSHNLEGGRCLAVHPLGERGVEIADAYAKSLKFAGFYEPAAP
jgi:tRNA A37 threonylcarbamoyladenosine biosynthesis protein TsaE